MFNFKNIVSWAARLVVAIILLQSLYYKFTSSEESVYIFDKLGVEPWGRYGTGIIELIASVLVLIPRFTGMGALIGAGVMTGAIFSHFSVLGIEVQNDGGLLFSYAIVVLLCCLYLVVEKWKTIPVLRDMKR